MINKLEDLGLRNNEAKVYLALLELGSVTSGPIVKKTGLHRVIIYDTLEKLIRKGLASFVMKSNRKYFEASDPSKLADFIEEKKSIVDEIMPQLLLKKQTSSTKQEAVIYQGIKGLKTVLDNMLRELGQDGHYWVFASGLMEPTMKSYYPRFQKQKKMQKVRSKILYDYKMKDERNILDATFGNTRFYPHKYSCPHDIFIYNDKTLLVVWIEDPPFAVQVTSKMMAEGYKNFFDTIWNLGKHPEFLPLGQVKIQED
ncbi:TrmB family transcriptional regulator [Nanoarchaeota archaeon]